LQGKLRSLVLFTGGPTEIAPNCSEAKQIFVGSEYRTAIADVLFGDVNPSEN
jgi:hypothetical protein